MTRRLSPLPEWVWLVAVTALAAVLRLWNLGSPRTLVFDETYYVKDAWTLLHLGYEGWWPDDADAAFIAGNVDVWTDTASFVVHPPLGKWIIAAGLAVFGADDPVGWRAGMAVVGILSVALVWVVARILFRSVLLAGVAGLLMAVDGQAIALSRVALLDTALMFFVLLGALFVLLDRGWTRRRLENWMRERRTRGRPVDWGPTLWGRPWFVAAGAAFGLATAVKWSGLWFLAAFAVYSVAVDLVARRRAGIRLWHVGTLLRQGPASFMLTVPVTVAAYAASWVGWFRSDSGYDRQWASGTDHAGEPNAWQGALSWVPHDVQSWWHHHVGVYRFHVQLDSEHGWESPAWQWLPLLRPTALHRAYTEQGDNGCTAGRCEAFITTLPNPLLWYLAVAALLVLIAALVLRRQGAWRAGFILVGVTAGLVPWLLYPDRTIFQFYTIAFLPFMVLALTHALGNLLGPPGSDWRRAHGVPIVTVVLILIVAVTAFFYPVWTGMNTAEAFTRSHYWLPGWR